MYVTAVRQLRLLPWDIAVLPGGGLLTLSWSVAGTDLDVYLDAYDGDLGTVWSRSLGPGALGLQLDQRGTPWVVHRTGASAFNREGGVSNRMDAPLLEGMEVAGLTFVETDFVFAYQHQETGAPDRPALVRMTRDGIVRWSSRPTAEAVKFDRDLGDRSTLEKQGPLQPTGWICGYGRAGDLVIAGDTLMVVYGDTPWTGLGIGYAISLTDGMLQYVTDPGPIQHVAARGSGVFLIGYSGYGTFETVLYDASGTRRNRWNSEGFLVIDGSDTRVIEVGNPRMSRLARLRSDGAVITGDLVDGFQTSRPYLHADGTVYFARRGMMHAARDLRIDERIPLSGHGPSDDMLTRVVAAEEGLFCAWSSNRPSTSGSFEYMSGLAHVVI
jgi:hypothetical protein